MGKHMTTVDEPANQNGWHQVYHYFGSLAVPYWQSSDLERKIRHDSTNSENVWKVSVEAPIFLSVKYHWRRCYVAYRTPSLTALLPSISPIPCLEIYQQCALRNFVYIYILKKPPILPKGQTLNVGKPSKEYHITITCHCLTSEHFHCLCLFPPSTAQPTGRICSALLPWFHSFSHSRSRWGSPQRAIQ